MNRHIVKVQTGSSDHLLLVTRIDDETAVGLENDKVWRVAA